MFLFNKQNYSNLTISSIIVSSERNITEMLTVLKTELHNCGNTPEVHRMILNFVAMRIIENVKAFQPCVDVFSTTSDLTSFLPVLAVLGAGRQSQRETTGVKGIGIHGLSWDWHCSCVERS